MLSEYGNRIYSLDFGYPTELPCEICGKNNYNQSEPRFGYVVCLTHQYIAPIYIKKAALKYKTDIANYGISEV